MRVRIRRRVRRAVEILQRQFLPPVQHVQQQPPIAMVIVHWLDDPEIRRKLHQPVAIPWRQPNVGNCRIIPVRRINGKMRHTVDPLIPTHVAKSLPARESRPRIDLQPGKRHFSSPQNFACKKSLGSVNL